MLKYNGGSIPLWNEYVFTSNKGEELFLESFHQLKHIDGSLEDYYKHNFLYPRLLSIGAITGGYIAIGYQNDNMGEIYAYFSDEDPFKIANSFTEFLTSLEVRNVD